MMMTTFKTVLLCFFAIIACLLCSCSKDNEGSGSLTFSSDDVEVYVGETSEVTVSGGESPYSVVLSNASAATAVVENNIIKIHGFKKGSTIVAVYDKNNNTGRIMVKVLPKLQFDKSNVTLRVGMATIVTVSEGTKPYSVKVEDESVATATVSDTQITITGIKTGSTTITVTDTKKNDGIISVIVE